MSGGIWENTSQVRPKHSLGARMWLVSMEEKELPTVAGVPVLPEEVALSAVTLVGAVDVGALLAARAGQALVHIWRLEVRAHYCRSLIKEAPSLHVNKTML